MPITSVLQVVDAVEDLVTRLNAVALSVAPNNTESIAAGLDGIRADGRVLLTELDATNEEDLVVVADGALVIEMWRWRRDTRKGIMALMGQARTIQDLAAELQGGQKQRVVVTRDGDTLQRIAARELGDWREWPRLLAANPGVGAGELTSGLSLVIPEKR